MKKAAIEKHGRAFNDDRFVDNKQAYPLENYPRVLTSDALQPITPRR